MARAGRATCSLDGAEEEVPEQAEEERFFRREAPFFRRQAARVRSEAENP